MPRTWWTILELSLFALVTTIPACAEEEVVYSDEPLYINELMAKNTAAVADELGEFDDWFEIFNGGRQDVDLGGYLVGDSGSERCRGEIGAGVIVPAGGVVVIWADGTPEQGPDHLPFRLSAGGEELYLNDPSCAQIDAVTFGELGEDVVLARHPDGEGELELCATATPAELNGSRCE